MWYVIQTTTGKEQELVDAIHKMLPPDSYKECFYLKRELFKRLGGEWLEVTETLFPAYVFLDVEEPELIFHYLKKVPELSKLLGDNDGVFIPLEDEEKTFLELVCQKKKREQIEKTTDTCGEFIRRERKNKYLVKNTRIYLDERGKIRRLEGPLEYFKEKIVKLNLRKRYAVVEIMMHGERHTILFGIKLERD